MIEDMIHDFYSHFSSPNIHENEYQSLVRYFDFSYSIIPGKNFFRVCCYAYLKGTDSKQITVNILVKEESIAIENKNSHLSVVFHQGKDKYREVDALLYYLVENKDIIDKTIEQYHTLVKSFKDVYRQDFDKHLKQLIERMNKKDLIKATPTVHLRPIIAYIDNKKIYIEYRIFQDKEYVLDNLDDFAYRLKRNAFYKYGKSLGFIHDKAVFDKESQTHIALIEEYNTGDNGRYLAIYKEDYDEFFNKVKGMTFEFNNEEYVARLEPVNIKIHVDKDMVLSTELDNKFIENLSYRYLFNKEEHTIDKVTADEDGIELIELINNSKYPTIDSNIDYFKYNVILRYPDLFDYDKSISEDFHFDRLTIKVYFDMEDNIITYREELFVDENKIDNKDLDKFNLIQYNSYQAVMSRYGFEDYKLKDGRLVWEFLSSDFTELKTLATVYLSESILSKDLTTFQVPNIKINYDSNLLDVFIDNSIYTDEELIDILSAIKHKKKFVVLKNSIIDVSGANSTKFFDLTNDFKLAQKNQITPQKLPVYYAFKSLGDAEGINLQDKVVAILEDIKSFKKNEIEIPPIEGTLRKYQIEGVKWLLTLYHHSLSGILADDMGLGKTIEIINFIEAIKEDKPILITAPKSLIYNWKNEFTRFNPKQKVVLIHGNKTERVNLIKKIVLDKKVVYITGYDSLRIDEDLYKDKRFNIHILDEAQAIKNANTKKSVSVTHIESNCRYILTGTPIENSVLDLWSLFNFLMPNYFPAIQEFKNRYENEAGYDVLIKKKIAPFILRRNKKDVLKDLPDKYEVIMTCDMSNEQRKVYDAHRLEAKMILDGGGQSFDVLYLLTRLRQICIDPSLFIENYTSNSGKIDSLMEIVRNKIEDGHRILIFSQFVKALEIVIDKLNADNVKYSIITGDTKGEDRVVLANEFNANEEIKIMLVSLKAGGTGLNLIGADTVIHLDPWWNVAAQNQATDRAHRIGQKQNVEVIKLICDNSIEQRVVELQNKKKAIIEQLISENDKSITSLSMEDIKYILK